jgi:hypothetical protein
MKADADYWKGFWAGRAIAVRLAGLKAERWETLWDDKSTDGSAVGYNGYLQWLWSAPSENLLSVGDVVRVTVDGVSTTLTVRNMSTGTSFVEGGNNWLGTLTNHTNPPVDDGTDIYFWEYRGSLRFFTRKMYWDEMPHVKFECLIQGA